MNTKDQNNFLQLSIKGFKQMAKDVGKFDKTLEKLAKDAAAQGKRGYLTFMNWFQKLNNGCLLYTSPSPRDGLLSRMPSSA